MLNWSFPLYRLWGIEVRIHWTLPLFYAFLVIQGALGGYAGFAALVMAVIFAQVLAHEYGHAFTARRLGEEAETILLSWLGGAAYCGAGANTRNAMRITIMGPAVNLLIAAASGLALFSLGLWSWDLLNPFGGWFSAPGIGNTALLVAFKVAVVLLLFNLCVPAYPLDGGRLLLVWAADRYGRLRGAKIATAVSIPVGFALTLWGLLQGSIILALIGLQVLFEAYQIRRLIEWGEIEGHPAFPADASMGGYDHTYGSYEPPPHRRKRRPGWFARWRAARREEARRRQDQETTLLRAQVDRLLEKVSREGIGSLSLEERKVLDEASRKYRGE